MQLSRWLAATTFILAASPALADTIVEDVGFTGSVATEPVFVTGPLFDPSLGTLTGIGAMVTGQYDAAIFIPNPEPRHLSVQLNDVFATPGASDSGSLGDIALSETGNTGSYSGLANFSFADTIPSLGAYIAGAPTATNYLAEISLGTSPIAGGGAASDSSTFSGTLALTYTYDVPEPSSLLVFGLGVGVMLLAAGHKAASRRPQGGRDRLVMTRRRVSSLVVRARKPGRWFHVVGNAAVVRPIRPDRGTSAVGLSRDSRDRPRIDGQAKALARTSAPNRAPPPRRQIELAQHPPFVFLFRSCPPRCFQPHRPNGSP